MDPLEVKDGKMVTCMRKRKSPTPCYTEPGIGPAHLGPGTWNGISYCLEKRNFKEISNSQMLLFCPATAPFFWKQVED